MFPTVLNRPAWIASPCRATGDPICVIMEPGRVVSVDPPTAVVSLVVPDSTVAVRTAFCNHVHFFRSAADAQLWLDEHPGAEVMPVHEAFDLGHRLAVARPNETDPAGGGCW